MQGFMAEQEAFLQEGMPRYLGMLRELVGMNSFTANGAGVDAVARKTADFFLPLGFTAEYVKSAVSEYGHHLILTRQGSGSDVIGLVSHSDTVFPEEEEQRNDFAWREDGDRIYGPGTVDIKGGTIGILMLLETMRQFAPEQFVATTWIVLIDAAEEADATDFGKLCIERLPAETRGCLIFEGGYYDDAKDEFWVVRARKGMGVFEVNVEGKASHAGTAHPAGANAIVQLAETVQQLAAITDYERNVTVNVGAISGGTVTNRVPHQASAKLEMRAFEPETHQAAIAQILALSGTGSVSNGDGDYQCEVNVTLQRRTEPWPINEKTDRLIDVWQQAGEKLGFVVKPELRGGLSDGNHFWHAVPTIDGLGVAGANAHCSERSADGSKDQEYCRVSSFVPKTLLNVTAVLLLLGHSF